jgi:hypothetical protein
LETISSLPYKQFNHVKYVLPFTHNEKEDEFLNSMAILALGGLVSIKFEEEFLNVLFAITFLYILGMYSILYPVSFLLLVLYKMIKQ